MSQPEFPLMHYESQSLLAEYLLFHYGAPAEVLPPDRHWPAGMTAALGFPQRTVTWFSPGEVTRGLDLGCAVGRATFEMARTCRQVVGIDSAKQFIATAVRLLERGAVDYERREEGHLRTPLVARPPAGIDVARVEFRHGDALDLPDDLGVFERVHAANLLCRLPEPRRLLDRLPSLVKPGGELVMATPGTWLEEFTPMENWPTGTTMEFLLERLQPHFVLLRHAEEPFLLRETARKFQWSTSLVTQWRRL